MFERVRCSYTRQDISDNSVFLNIVDRLPNGRLHIDFQQFHQVELQPTHQSHRMEQEPFPLITT